MLRRTCGLLLLTVASLASAPGVAHALGVNLSIRGAGTVQETSVLNLVGLRCGLPGFQSPPTTPTGAPGGQCIVGSHTGGYQPGSTVEYLAIPAPGYEFQRWQSAGAVGTAVVCDRSTPPTSLPTYTGTTCRFVITDNLQTQAAFVDDTDPAMSALSGPEAAVSGPAVFSFSAAADPTFRRFECRVPGLRDAWTTCSTGIQEDPPSGTWQFEVRAVDWSNNRSAASSWTWEVDKQEPDTSLTGGAERGGRQLDRDLHVRLERALGRFPLPAGRRRAGAV